MSDSICPGCRTPVPVGAGFCVNCGEATPTQITDESVRAGAGIDGDQLEYRHRLAAALGRDYQLGDLIGQGGFGVVYAARDKKLDRDVAVKALRHDLFPTPAILQRFEREARAVAKLRHPNILPIYTVGEGEGIAFMVMPMVEGESLRQTIDREGKLSVDEAVRITVETARALEVAHGHALVHRDIKPENIMLDGKDRHALLMDFGIAKVATPDDTGLTGTGVIIGSPSYMSPEQARGESDIDARADIYALGAVAYEMLAGTRPFKAANLHELVYRQVTEAPAPLSELAPAVPRAVAETIMSCLEKEPDGRPSSAASLADALAQRDAIPVEGSKPAGAGMGTAMLMAIVILAMIVQGIAWFGDVAAVFDGHQELGKGFSLAVSLLLPFQYLSAFLIVASVVLMGWNLSLLYRHEGDVRQAFALAFSRPTRTAVAVATGIVGTMIVVHLTFVMPTLQSMVAAAGVRLPPTAQLVSNISGFLQRWWWAILLLVIGGYQVVRRRPRQTPPRIPF